MKRYIVNPIIKDTATFIQTSAESDGKVSEFDFTLMPGGGNPLHYHKTYSETFTVLQGELGLFAGKQKIILRQGETYTVQPNQPHRFFNPGDKEIKFKVKLSPGHEGMENALRILYGMAQDGLTDKNSVPKKLKHLAMVAYTSDMNIPGLPRLLFPLLKRIAQRAIAKGEYQKLIDNYCK
jgi:quercetin dioxygenase-like cupin family protein